MSQNDSTTPADIVELVQYNETEPTPSEEDQRTLDKDVIDARTATINRYQCRECSKGTACLEIQCQLPESFKEELFVETYNKGVAERESRTAGRGGGVLPEAEKKNCTRVHMTPIGVVEPPN
jgi:hypothetical protein